MNINNAEKLINYGLSKGASFVELFFEDSKYKIINYLDSRVEKVSTSIEHGVGVRLVYNDVTYYGSTSNIDYDNIALVIDELSLSFTSNGFKEVKLVESTVYDKSGSHDVFNNSDKKVFLNELDSVARLYDSRVNQVNVILKEVVNDVIIASSLGHYTKDKRLYSRVYATVYLKENDKLVNNNYNIAFGTGYEKFDKELFKSKFIECIDEAILKLNPISIKAGYMPVIIGNGFGGVIIHEACGHAMEATSVAKGISVLSDKLNKRIASDKVSIIDDSTIEDGWGSLCYDDEGLPTSKRLLVKDGILVNYLIDYINGLRMGMESNGCSRRESYKYNPTSRMSNTYLVPGTDKIEDMISSIDYGLYAKGFSGGVVQPATGQFNFTVTEGYLIEDGKVKGLVSNVSLIGTCSDILEKIDMVSDDLEYGYGMCGSESGSIPVTASQPTIRVSSILVGGDNE